MLLEAFACSSHLSSCWHLLDSTSSSWRPWRDRLDGASFGAVAAACQREQLPRRCEETKGENTFGKHHHHHQQQQQHQHNHHHHHHHHQQQQQQHQHNHHHHHHHRIFVVNVTQHCSFNKLIVTEALLLTAEFGSSALSSLPSTILSRHGDSGKSGNHRGDGGKRNITVSPGKSKSNKNCLKEKNIFYICILFLQCLFFGQPQPNLLVFLVDFFDVAIL